MPQQRPLLFSLERQRPLPSIGSLPKCLQWPHKEPGSGTQPRSPTRVAGARSLELPPLSSRKLASGAGGWHSAQASNTGHGVLIATPSACPNNDILKNPYNQEFQKYANVENRRATTSGSKQGQQPVARIIQLRLFRNKFQILYHLSVKFSVCITEDKDF